MKRQENRAVIAWRGAASAGLFSSADRAYMKAPVPRPTPNYGTKCPRQIATLTKKQTDFLFKIEMGGKPFCGFAISPINCELLCKTLYFSIFYYEQCCKYNFKNKHH